MGDLGLALTTFNPFPWFRPSEDRRARDVEPLVSPGLGQGRTPGDPLPAAGQLALAVGLVVPLAMLAFLLLFGLPLPVLVLLGAGAVFLVFLGVCSRRAALRRARERAAAHAARHPPAP